MSIKEKDKPYFTEEQYKYLDKLFPEPKIEPGVDSDDLMYRAGARCVLDIIANRVHGLRRFRIGD